MDITVKSISGQDVVFSDNSELKVPWVLTAAKNDTDITLKLDCSRKMFVFPLDVTKRYFVTCVNVLMVDHWRITGKIEKNPTQIPYESN